LDSARGRSPWILAAASKHANRCAMSKQPEPDRVPKEQSDRIRDEALKRMLKTPPRAHADEPKRAKKKSKTK
jgi:hypothetical protein